jgi:hypothetical protein
MVGAGGLLFLVGWLLYAPGRYRPLEVPWLGCGVPAVIGAVTLNIVAFRRIAKSRRREQRTVDEKNLVAAAKGEPMEMPRQRDTSRSSWRRRVSEVMGVVLASTIFGGLAPVSCALTLNALCDFSPAVLRPVHITGMWTTEHHGVFRTYSIEYVFTDVPAHEKHEVLSTPWEMDALGHATGGVAHVHKGFFGWPWVDRLTPVVLNPGAGKRG